MISIEIDVGFTEYPKFNVYTKHGKAVFIIAKPSEDELYSVVSASTLYASDELNSDDFRLIAIKLDELNEVNKG